MAEGGEWLTDKKCLDKTNGLDVKFLIPVCTMVQEDITDVWGDEDSEAPGHCPLIGAVDVITKLPSDFYDKIAGKNWRDRMQVLVELKELLQVPQLQDGNYDDVINALNKVITKDPNSGMVSLAATCIGLLSSGLRHNFKRHAVDSLKVILDKFSEKKPDVQLSLRQAADNVFRTTSLEAIKEVTVSALNHRTSSVKVETVNFLGRCFSASSATTLRKLLKYFVPVLLMTINDKASEVREASCNALGIAMKVVSEGTIMPFLVEVDAVKISKIKEYSYSTKTVGTAHCKSAPEAASQSTQGHAPVAVDGSAVVNKVRIPRSILKEEVQLSARCKSKSSQLEHLGVEISNATQALADEIKKNQVLADQAEQTNVERANARQALADEVNKNQVLADQLEQTNVELANARQALADENKKNCLLADQLEQTNVELANARQETATLEMKLTHVENAQKLKVMVENEQLKKKLIKLQFTIDTVKKVVAASPKSSRSGSGRSSRSSQTASSSSSANVRTSSFDDDDHIFDETVTDSPINVAVARFQSAHLASAHSSPRTASPRTSSSSAGSLQPRRRDIQQIILSVQSEMERIPGLSYTKMAQEMQTLGATISRTVLSDIINGRASDTAEQKHANHLVEWIAYSNLIRPNKTQ